MKLEVKKEICCETCQSGYFSLVSLNNSKFQSSTNDVPNDFLSFYSTFETETSTATNERQDSI